MPGAGKTTVAKTIDGIRMSPDEWMRDLGIDLWDSTARDRIQAVQWSLTQELAIRGLTIAVEWGVWSRRERDEVREWCRAHDVAVELRYLDVPLDELDRRLAERNGRPGEVTIDPAMLRVMAGWFDRPTPEELALYDD